MAEMVLAKRKEGSFSRMKYVEMAIYTTKSIRDTETVHKYLRALEQHGFYLERIGLSEPTRQPYSLENAINMWTHEEDGCYVEGIGMVGKAGGMIGKSSKPRFFVQTLWWDCPNEVNLNWVSFNITDSLINKRLPDIIALFKGAINILKADYGFIGHEDTVYRQHVTGTLESRLPGVFWYNYFGPQYVEFFTEEKITSFPWSNIEKLHGGLITSLSENPKELLDDDKYEIAAKEHLGTDSFGDIEEYLKDPWAVQQRQVPKLS